MLKPRHSGFFRTSLETLLEHLEVSHLLLTGFTTDICVLLTASGAYMRDYRLSVPADCAAALTPEQHRDALTYMQRVLEADVTPAAAADVSSLA